MIDVLIWRSGHKEFEALKQGQVPFMLVSRGLSLSYAYSLS